MAELFDNSFITSLTADINASQPTIPVNSAASAALQAAGGQFRILIDAERMLVTAGANTTTWTVTRGIENSAAASHTNGTSVAHILTVGGFLNHHTIHEPGGADPFTLLDDTNFNVLVKDGLATRPSLRTLGTGAQQAMPGNATPPPAAHHTTHEPGGTDVLTALTDANFAAANKDGAVATPSLRTLGTGAQQAVSNTDSRLSNARTPTAHASTHRFVGADPLYVMVPTTQSSPYLASAGDIVLMNGANTVSIPTGQPDNTQIAVVALASGVPVQCGGTDTINIGGVSSASTTVASGTSLTLVIKAGVWYGMVSGGGSGGGGGTTVAQTLQPTNQSGPYIAAANQLVLMTGNNPVTLLAGPPSGTQIGVYALTAPVTVNTTGADTIDWGGYANQRSLTVPAGLMQILTYNAGVWYGAPEVTASPGGTSVPVATMAARMYRNASMSAALVAGGFTKIPLDTTAFDTSGLASLAQGRINIAVSGYYQIDASAAVAVGSATQRVVVTVYRNGAEMSRGSDTQPNTGVAAYVGGTVADVQQLNAGDYLELYVYLSAGTNGSLETGSSAMAYLSAVLLTSLPGAVGPVTPARAYRNTAASTAGGGWGKINIDTVAYDPGGNISTTSARYTAPASGFYQVNGAVVLIPGASDTIIAGIYVNGVLRSQGARIATPVSGSTCNVPVSDTIQLNAGDYVELWVYTAISDPLTGFGVSANFLSVVQVGNLAATPASTACARAYRNAALTLTGVSNTKISIDTVSFDTSGLVSVANSRIQITTSGYYQVDAQAQGTATADAQLIVAYIYKNGSANTIVGSVGQSTASGQGVGSVISDVMSLNAGDYLELYAYCSSTLSMQQSSACNYISVTLLTPLSGTAGPITAARMHRAAAMTSTANAWTKAPMDTKTFDPANNVDIVNSRYICPATGYYQVQGSISAVSNATGQRVLVAIYKNGVLAAGGAESDASSSSQGPAPAIADVIPCNAGDYIELYYYISAALAIQVGPGLFMSVVQVGNSMNFVNASGDLAGTYPNPTVQRLNGQVNVPKTAPQSGQVMITDGLGGSSWGNVVNAGTAARMYRNAALTLTASTWTKVPLDTISFDTSGLASIANGRINVNVAGYYQIEGQAAVGTGGATHTVSAAIYVNGALRTQGAMAVVNGANVPVADTLQLNAGDYIELWAYSSAADPLTATQTYLSVALETTLPSALGPTTPARAYRNAAFTLGANGWTKIPVDTIGYDPGGNFSTVNSRYTCPATGYYQVDGAYECVIPAATGRFVATIYKNGVEVSRGDGTSIRGGNAGDAYNMSVSDVIFCNAGDYLELWAYNGAAATAALQTGLPFSYLSAVQVGNLTATPASTACARAYRAAAGNVGPAAFSKIPLDTTSFDTSGMVQLSNGRMVAPVAGIYQVEGAISYQWPVSATGYLTTCIYVNGTESLRGGQVLLTASNAGNNGFAASGKLSLNAGDYVELYGYTSYGTAVAINPAISLTYLSMALLTPLSGTAGPQTAGRAFRNAGFSIGGTSQWTKIPLDTKSYDLGNNFDVVTNNRYVCPATGTYQVNGAMELNVGTSVTAQVGIYRNGSLVSVGGQVGSGAGYAGAVVADVIQCSAGDYLELWAQVSAGGTGVNVGPSLTYLSVVQVGNSMNFSAASGDLSGQYPNPKVSKLNGAALPAGQGVPGQYLQTNGIGQLSWASQNPSTMSARVHRAAALGPFSVGVWTKVPMDTATFDTSGLSNLASGRLVASVAGYYQIDGQVAITPAGSTSDTIVAAIYVNGTERSRGNRSISIATTVQSVDVGDVVQLNAGDQVELWVQTTTADSLSVSVTTDNYLSMVLLNSIPAATGVTTPARAYRNAALTTSAGPTKISLDTLSYDPGGNISTATGRYTCPATGIYQVTANIYFTCSPGNSYQTLVYKNGAQVAAGDSVLFRGTSGDALNLGLSELVQCNAGDYLELWAYSQVASALLTGYTYYNTLSVVQVGNLAATPASTACARVYRSAAFTCATAGFNKIPMDTVDYDTTGLFDSANGRLRAPVAGIYQIDGEVNLAASAGAGYIMASIARNGSETVRGNQIYTASGQTTGALVSTKLSLNAGDYVELWAYNNPGGGALAGGPLASSFTMALLTPLSGTAGPITAARAYRNGAYTTVGAVWTKLPLDTVSSDPGGNVSLVTGRYVCPATGAYQVNGAIQVANVADGSYIQAGVGKNGTYYSAGALVAAALATQYPAAMVSDVIQCNAGDYLELFYFASGAFAISPSAQGCYFSVVQVGNSMNFTQAAGDLSGQYPNPTVAKFNGMTLPTGPGIQGQYLQTNGAGVLGWAGGGAATGQKLRTPVLDVGVLGQIRAGRQLTNSDFAALGLSNPLGLWNLSDLTDASGNTRTLTNKGAVPFGTGINGVASTAAVFSGSSAQALYISDTGAADPFRIKTGTVGSWFRTAKLGVGQAIISKRSTATGQFVWDTYISGANVYSAWASPDGTAYTVATGVSAVTDDRWHFGVTTFDGSVIRLYVDGVLEATASFSGPMFSGSGPLNIGSEGSDGSTTGSAPPYGRIDEAFVTADVLSPEQIRALYCAKIAHGYVTIPTSFNLAVRRQKKGALFVAATDFPTAPLRLHNFTNGSLNDEGSNATPLTNNNAALTVSGADGLGTGAYNFVAASTQSLSSTDTGLPTSGARTYGYWFKTTAGVAVVAMGWGSGSGTSSGVCSGVLAAGTIFSSSGTDVITGPVVTDGQWHFAIVVEDPAAGDGVKRKLYLDGAMIGGSTVLNTVTLGGANRFRIGSQPDAGVPFTGQIDGVFACGYALTQDQVSTLYAKGSQTMSPSPKNAGDHVEYADATNVYAVFDTLDTQHQIDLIVSG